MKKLFTTTIFLACAAIALHSCKSSQESTVAQRKSEIEQSKEPTTACFVKMNDGTIRNFATLKLVTGMFKTPYLLADGKLKITAKEIKSYQNKAHYAISQNCFTSGHKSYVAKETLPGFAIRIAKGKINVYAKKYYNGSIAVDEYFVQKGEDGQILAYTTENMNKLVKDDDEALAFFMNKKYTTSKTKKEQEPLSYANAGKIKKTVNK